jgi:hypothetical protein
MQLGGYVCFDEPLSENDKGFIKYFNTIFSSQSGPIIRLIYKPFNRIPYNHDGQEKEDYNPDMPDYKYSLGWKVTIPEARDAIKPDMPPGMKRVFKKLLG